MANRKQDDPDRERKNDRDDDDTTTMTQPRGGQHGSQQGNRSQTGNANDRSDTGKRQGGTGSRPQKKR